MLVEQEQKGYSILELIDKGKAAFRYLLSKAIIIFVIAVLFGCAGIYYATIQKPLYTARLTFFPSNEGGTDIRGFAGLASQIGFDAGSSGSAFEGENLIQILKSRTLVETALLTPVSDKDNRLMIELYFERNKNKASTETNDEKEKIRFESYPAPENRKRDSVINIVYRSIVGKQMMIGRVDKKVDLIEITLADNDEFFAKRFVEILSEKAIDFYTNYKVKRSRQNVEVLQKQADSVKRALFGNISAVATINDLNVNPLRQVQRVGVQKRQADVSTNSAVYTELVRNLELAKLALRKETPLIQIIDTPKFPLEKKKMGRFKGALLFAFVGGILAIVFFLLRYWFIQLNRSLKRIVVTEK